MYNTKNNHELVHTFKNIKIDKKIVLMLSGITSLLVYCMRRNNTIEHRTKKFRLIITNHA